jgi:hypothetical protein
MRKPLHTLVLYVTICLAVCLTSTACPAQDSATDTHPIVSSVAYGRILDTVFSQKKPKTSQLQYSMVLRFMSSKHTEAEVVVNVFNGGKAEATLFKASGSSVWNIANDYIQKTGREDVEQIAKLVQTTKQPVSISPVQAALWHSGALKSLGQSSGELQQDIVALGKTGETTIFLDGTTYELWFNQGLTEIHWIVMDEEVNDANAAGRASIAQWMNKIRRYAFDHIEK